MAFDTAEYGSALVEWVNSLGVSESVTDVGDLADGELLLRVMHGAAPKVFPGPNAVHLWRLLEGLQTHFRGRHRAGEASAQELLRQASLGCGSVDASRLAELVVCGAVESDLPQRQGYIEACMRISHAGQQAIMAILERFHVEGENYPPSPAGSTNGSPEQRPGEDDAYNEDERRNEELFLLRRALDEERERRQAAQEVEKAIRAELLLADEARERVRDEQRVLFDLRLEQEVASYQEELHHHIEEIAQLRDELDVARSQAGATERLTAQLRECKKKLEESQTLKRRNGELEAQIGELMSSDRSGAGAVERMQTRLEQLRSDAAHATAQRDAAQHQVSALSDKLEKARQELREAKEEAALLRRELQASQQQRLSSASIAFGLGDSPTAVSPSVRGVGPEASETQARETQVVLSPRGGPTPRSSAATPRSKKPPSPLQDAALPPKGPSAQVLLSPKSSSVDELRQLIHSQKDDLFERLLAEKERATKAETTLQLQLAEVERLSAHRASDAKRIAGLEAQLREGVGGSDAQGSRNSGGDGGEAGDGDVAAGGAHKEKIRELQELVALRDREVQVQRWRSRADADAVAAQESLLANCFHELGLRYHRLRVQFDALQHRLQVAEGDGRSGGDAPAAR